MTSEIDPYTELLLNGSTSPSLAPTTSTTEAPPLLPLSPSLRPLASKAEMVVAATRRASRAARPAEPSPVVQAQSLATVKQREQQLLQRGLRRIQNEQKRAAAKFTGSRTHGTMDGANVAVFHHMAHIKSRSFDSGFAEPSWLIPTDTTCPQT